MCVQQEVQHGTETENFPTVPLLTELLLASHEDHEVLADASTNVTILGAAPAPTPAPAPATVPVGSATARYRNRKKPPRWLQAKQSKAGSQPKADDVVTAHRTAGRRRRQREREREIDERHSSARVPPDVERLVVPGEGAAQRVADGPLAAVVRVDELVVAQVVRQLLEPHQPRQRQRLLPLLTRRLHGHDARRRRREGAAPPAAPLPGRARRLRSRRHRRGGHVRCLHPTRDLAGGAVPCALVGNPGPHGSRDDGLGSCCLSLSLGDCEL
jgi:hypothetical protein